MFDYGRGVKAAAKAGIIAFLFGAILNFIFVSGIQSSFYYSYSYYFNPFLIFIGSIISSVISGVIFGAIIGLIFARTYNSLPGSNSKVKAISLSLIVWFIFSLIISGIINAAMYASYGNLEGLFISTLVIGILQYVIFGFLLSKFWDEYGRKYVIKTKNRYDQPDSVLKNRAQNQVPQNNQLEKAKNEKDDLQKRIDELSQKNQSLDLSEVISLDHLYVSQRKKAKEILDNVEERYAEFEELQQDLKNIKIKTNRLTDRLANGGLDSESYKRALDDLEKARKEKEERLWNLRSKLFKEDDYEKPF